MMKKTYLLVDGYNIIFAWNELKEISQNSLEEARDRLVHILSNYQGVKKYEIIVVFDAYKITGGAGSVEKRGNITVVFTKEAETADNYIESTVGKLKRDSNVLVATSDNLEQVIIMSKGAVRLSASELLLDVNKVNKTIEEKIKYNRPVKDNLLMDNLDEKTRAILEKMRRE
ncbi:MAG: NYN domain-containing protein [Clostridiales bacterium]|nr:NYN domain-containing protein [Clostridiales bacterium]